MKRDFTDVCMKKWEAAMDAEDAKTDEQLLAEVEKRTINHAGLHVLIKRGFRVEWPVEGLYGNLTDARAYRPSVPCDHGATAVLR